MSSGLLGFRIGGSFTSYLLYLLFLSFSLFNNFLDVLTTDLLKSAILLLLTFSADKLAVDLVP